MSKNKECDICGLLMDQEEFEYCHEYDCCNGFLDPTDATINTNYHKSQIRCKYCTRFLSKCRKCSNNCYVCVFDDCGKSQITGKKLVWYSYLCIDHSACYDQNININFMHVSNNKCDTCGLFMFTYKPICEHISAHIIKCPNCTNIENMFESFYCYQCL